KKLEVLIDSAPDILENYPNAKFRIVGEGIHGKWYREYVEKKGLSENFIFEGYVTQSELIKAYQKCDVFAIPSDTETQGIVTLEAMSCRKPVVGANARGLKDVVSHETDGYLFQPGNSRELSDYLLTLLSDSEKREKMGKEAREKAKQFSSEKIGEKWVNFYSSLLD
ncbi:MAG: glycosyltransferase family 4 protein, partial [Hadesarchaea archaeon]|nr:glycosyltransferase family 4 protein [Hadesarchaea archaeon]